VQSVPGPGEQPQTFETVEEFEARPEWNAIGAATTLPYVPGFGATDAWLAGTGLNLKPGDAVLLAGTDIAGEAWDLRTLTTVVPDDLRGRTYVSWAEGLGSTSPYAAPATSPNVFVLRKRINVFGYNAPQWKAMSSDFRNNYRGSATDTGEWPSFTISPAGEPNVDLDGSHPDIVTNSWIVLSTPTYRELWRVDGVTELSRAEFATSGKVTRLTLGGGENYATFGKEVRNTTVFAVSEPVALAEAPDTSSVQGKTVTLAAGSDVSAMRPGRRLLLRGVTTADEERAETVVLAAVEKVGSHERVTLAVDLVNQYKRDSVVVHGNVARATHGETVQQLLGSGQARTPFQRFKLAHAPLTYVQSAKPSGADSTLEVRVNDARWNEAPTLYGAGSRDRSYVVRADEAGNTYVEFGDGVNGARLPSGSQNVRAKYRKGLGAAGNVGRDRLSQLVDRPLGVKGVGNPIVASGGVDPEADDAARRTMPLSVRTLGRAVSLLDYEDFARAFVGVAKANASVLPLRGGRTIVVTVALEGTPGPEVAGRLAELTTSLRTYGDPFVEVIVCAQHTDTFRVALRVAVDAAYEAKPVLAAVEAAMRARYSFDARDFGEPAYHSEIDEVVHAATGVVAVDIDRLYLASAPAPGIAERLLAQQPAVGPGGVAIPAGLLLLDPAPFDWLEVMT
jgi:hypothetical protein